MHELCMCVKGDPRLKKEDVIVAFGSARFSSSSLRGLGPVPLLRFRKHLERYATVVLTSEMRTSRVCSNGCGWDGHPEPASDEEGWARKKEYDLVPMRGQRRRCGHPGPNLHAVLVCPTCKMVWNRDVNAARNIGYMFLWQCTHNDEPPARFCRYHSA